MKNSIEYISENTYKKELEEIMCFFNFNIDEIKEEKRDFIKPTFGDIWICSLPVLIVGNNKISFKTQNRPVLIIDDTKEHFIRDDNKNYYGLKITSQQDSYHRIKIQNEKNLGLHKKSYIRLELPLKIEREQLLYKISQIPNQEMNMYLKKIVSFVQKQV